MLISLIFGAKILIGAIKSNTSDEAKYEVPEGEKSLTYKFIPLPLKKDEIQTDISYDEISERLKSLIKTRCQGSVESNTFKISRKITYKNSFSPVVEGELKFHTEGTKITFKLRLNSFVKIFMAILFVGVSLGMVGIFMSMIMKKSMADLGPDVFLMGLLGFALVTIGYNIEAKKLIPILSETFFCRTKEVNI